MRIHTLAGILFALVGSILLAFLVQQNTDLLQLRFQLSQTATVPVYSVLIAVFLLGFLPIVTVLVVKTLKQDLASRRHRRFERETRSLQGSYRRAIDFLEDGQWRRAAAELETVLASQPEDFETLLSLGEALRCQGRVEEALNVHRRASVLYPQSVAVLYALVRDYEAQGSPKVADEIRDRILRDFPGLGLQILKQRRDKAAVEQEWSASLRLQEAIEGLQGDDAQVSLGEQERSIRRGLRFENGVELLADGRFDEAATIFQTILTESGNFVPARIMLGEAKHLGGDSMAAVAQWHVGWQSTASPTFLQRIEDHFIEREEPMQAIETFRQVIAEAENDLLPRFFLGKLYARLEMHDEALKILGSIRDRVHESPVLLYLIGRLYERRGDEVMAGKIYRSSVELTNLATDIYLCDRCGAEYGQWLARCDRCGQWDAIELRFQVEPVGGEELAIQERPVWPVDGES